MRGLEGQGIHDPYKIGNGRGKVKRGLGGLFGWSWFKGCSIFYRNSISYLLVT